MNKVHIKLTSAIGIGGLIYRAGSIVEVSDDAAKNLLHRGKGVLATAEDEGSGEEEQLDLSKLNKAQLLEAAKAAGVDVPDTATKADIIAAMEAAAKAE